LAELRSLHAFDPESYPLEQARKRLGKWRHARILNGVYGSRLERTGDGLAPVVLLVLPPGEALPDGGNAFRVTIVRETATAEDALTWLSDHYEDEAGCWQTESELDLLLTESKKRRRFQSWGIEFSRGVVTSI
jgi:hypothetical protein